MDKNKFSKAKTFKVSVLEIERIERLQKITLLTKSKLIDLALKSLEIEIRNGKTISEIEEEI